MRRKVIFSPSFITKALRASSTVCPDASLRLDKAATSAGLCSATNFAASLAKAEKSSFFATKSVSQFTSTSAPSLPSTLIKLPIMPSAAMRPAALVAFAPLLMRSKSSAFFMSPSDSAKAFLHSIMPSPVCSRNSFTILAVMSAMSKLLNTNSIGTNEKGAAAPFLFTRPARSPLRQSLRRRFLG